jgi:alditol oxidase
MQIVHANGELKTYHRSSLEDDSPISFCWIHLGALGVVVSATMELEPKYHVAKGIYLDLSYSTFLEHIDEILGPSSVTKWGEFISVFMDWTAPTMSSTWVGRKYYPSEDTTPPIIPKDLFGAQHCPGRQYHPVPGQDPGACIITGYGSWTSTVNHFLPDHAPSSAGNEIQAEYFALEALWAQRDIFADLVQITELRAIAQDDLPLSQAKHEAVVGIHFTLFKVAAAQLNEVLAKVETILEAFEFKIHWGKWFVCRGKKLQRLYDQEDIDALRRLIHSHDPEGRFRNQYIWSCILN